MGIESIPLIVFLLLPGFLSWLIFCWGTVPREISQFQHFIASLILSIIAFSIGYSLIYLIKVTTDTLDSFPHYTQILGHPGALSPELAITIYPIAIGLGFLLIRAYKSRGTRDLFGRVGLDLYGHEDVWLRAFREHNYITVYLKDGNIVAGWPTYYSQTGGTENTELYLRKIRYYQKEQNRWVEASKSVEGLLIKMNMISHIEFRRPKETGEGSQQSVEPAIVLNRIDFLRMGMLLCSFGLILFSIRGHISTYGIVGPVLVVSSLVFIAAVFCEKLRGKINNQLAKRKSPLIRNSPRLFEWIIFLIVFTSGLIYSLGGPIQNRTLFIIVYVIAVIWMFVSVIQLILRPRHQ